MSSIKMNLLHSKTLAYRHYVIIFLMVSIISITQADRTSKKIYEPIDGALACFRRMNATHQFGCSSDLTGNVGVLHLVNDSTSLDWVVKTGPHSPYIPIIYTDDFTREFMIPFKDSGRVRGVLLLKSSSRRPEHFSTDRKCPNMGFGLYNQSSSHYCEKWNEHGNELLYEDWDFPIFLVNEEEEAMKITNCFDTFNSIIDGQPRDWPLCSAQLQSHMLAAVDSETCIRRTNIFSFQPARICDPMGDLNLWGSLFPRNQTQPYKDSSNGSVIVVGARLDASSMFDRVAPGADSAATGLAAFVAIVKHLSEMKEELLKSVDIENIFFILFNGEAFDYIGSSRIVYDMMHNSFPFKISDNSSSLPAILKLENIKYFIEVNQVALDGQDSTYFVHSEKSPEVQQLVEALTKQSSSRSITIQQVDVADQGFPPSSFQSFRSNRPNLPGIVITNYDKSFRNKYYNSIYDDFTAVNFIYNNESTSFDPKSIQSKIAGLSAAVAQTIKKIMIKDDTTVTPDPEFINELLYCYLQSGKCKIFRDMAGHDQLQNYPLPLYVGVYYSINLLSILTRNLLAVYQGTNVTKPFDECNRDFDKQWVDYQWINETCYETTVNYSTALSPAFHQSDGTISWPEWNSGKYSTWTESVWQKFTVRIFLKPSLSHEMMTLGFGFAVFLNGPDMLIFANESDPYGHDESPIPTQLN